MENYIVINGKKAELTEEQLKSLGIETKKIETPKEKFERKFNQRYYTIRNDGIIYETEEQYANFDDNVYNVANYCTDKELMEQRALHEILNRQLWRFSCENGELENKWNYRNPHFFIHYDLRFKQFEYSICKECQYQGVIYFPSMEIARKAVDEIIKPFMEEHPDFVW